MRAVHVVVSGRVQRVGFRYATQKQATLLGIAGWVKNVSDGSVEIHAEGAEDAVEKFLDWCRIGSMASRVDNVYIEDVAPKEFLGFVRR